MSKKPIVYIFGSGSTCREPILKASAATGFAVMECFSEADLQRHYDRTRPGCVILAPGPGAPNISEQFHQIRKQNPHAQIILIASNADIRNAAAAIKLGEVEIVEPPVEESSLRAVIEAAVLIDLQLRKLAAGQA